MPVVNEDIDLPGGGDPGVNVVVELTDIAGNVVAGYKGTKTFLRPARPTVTAGAWTLTLEDNSTIEPAGTVYQRTATSGSEIVARDRFIVPVGGGPYNIKDILAEALGPLPDPVPTNLIDSVTITTPTSELTTNGLTPALIPGMSVTIPDIPEQVLIRASALLKPETTRSQATVGTTNGSVAITGPGGAFGQGDVGHKISGTGLAGGNRIVAVASATAATIAPAATATGSITATIAGGPASVALHIAPDDTPSLFPSNEMLDMAWFPIVSTDPDNTPTAVAKCIAEYIVPASSPGTYYASMHCTHSGTIRGEFGTNAPARMIALRLGAA